MRELEYPFDGEYLLRKKKSIRRELLSREIPYLKKKVAVLGGSTTGNVILMLELFLLNYGIQPEFYESEYNRFWQDAMFENKELEEFKPDIIYIHTGYRNITEFPRPAQDGEEIQAMLEREYGHFEEMWNRIARVYGCPVIQNNFEYPFYRLLGNKDASDIHGRVNYITRLNMRFYEYAQKHENFYINDINYQSADYGLEKWSDSFYWHMYKYAPAVPAIPMLSFNIARIIKSIFGKNKKALVLDLDNTLWGGVVGDDGPENLIIGPETSMGQVYSEFQEYIKAHKDIGVLLNVDSKNDEENAMAGLNHPDGCLKPEDFIVIKANWQPKDVNFTGIAKELNILPESLVFVDDNPAERHIVRNRTPEAAVPELDKVENYIKILDRSGFFEVTGFSSDDLKRNEMYRENREREKAEASFSNYGDYLKSLGMKALIRPFEPLYMARIAQLTNKSNQFNLTTRRFTQAEIEEAAASGDTITLYGKLEDRFGDNGVVTVVIGRRVGDTLHLELWLMSCRVLKRDMEYAMMDELVKHCRKKNITLIKGYYYPTAKNGMVKEFYGQLGFTKTAEDENGNSEWEFAVTGDYMEKNYVIEVSGE